MKEKLFSILLYGSIFCHFIAAFLTYGALNYFGKTECNPVMANAFIQIGHIPAFILSVILIIAAFYLIEFLTNRNWMTENMEISELCLFTALMGFDAAHDIFVLTNNPMADISMFVFRIIAPC